MKCPFTLKALRNSLLVCLLVGGVASNDACAAEAIETTFYKAETMLKKHPTHLAQFRAFRDRYYGVLRNILDTNNKESYATHTEYVAELIRVLQADLVANDSFKCIKNLNTALYAELSNLLILLKSHVGTRSPAVLGLALAARFEHLLPKAILKEFGGAFKLASLLEHRLSC